MKHIQNHRIACILTIICTLFNFNSALAQQNSAYVDYIQKYHQMAIDQMNRHRIPASITLAQGLLESAAGTSTLATKANNHFGIKVGGDWTGPYIVRDDDRKGEHFRKYKSAAESFEDHSKFLKKARYASLFELKITDYKGWARGLKQCGYATSPTYAQQLIKIIETYNLMQYDKGGAPIFNTPNTITQQTGYVIGNTSNQKQQNTGNQKQQNTGNKRGFTILSKRQHIMTELETQRDIFFNTHTVNQCNHNYYIIMQSGDNLDRIAKYVGVKKRRLEIFNDLPKGYEPRPGSIIYFERKRTHADKAFKNRPHVLQNGQSLYDVAQQYGITLKSLYKMNNFPADYMPRVGQYIRVY